MILTEEEAKIRWPVTGRNTSHGKGYIRLKCPSHPNADKTGYVYEHTYVASRVLGRGLRRNEVAHHIYGDTTDNKRLLICTPAYHRQLHERLGESVEWPEFRPHKSSRPRCSRCHVKIAFESSTGLCRKHFDEFVAARAKRMICRVDACDAQAGARSHLCLPHLKLRSNRRRYDKAWEFPS